MFRCSFLVLYFNLNKYMYIFIEWIWFMVFKLLDDKDCLIFVFLEIGKVSIGVYGNLFF